MHGGKPSKLHNNPSSTQHIRFNIKKTIPDAGAVIWICRLTNGDVFDVQPTWPAKVCFSQ